MKTIKSIDLIFENCDYLVIGREDISFLEMKNIDKSVQMIKTGGVIEVNVVNDLKIGVKDNVLPRYTKLGTIVSDKLHYLDMAQITLNFENGESDVYFTAWTPKDDKDYRNAYQVNDYSESGIVVILINKNVPVIK